MSSNIKRRALMGNYWPKDDLALISIRGTEPIGIPGLPLFSGDLSELDQVVVLRFNGDFTVEANPARLTHRLVDAPAGERGVKQSEYASEEYFSGYGFKQLEYAGEKSFSGYSGGPVLTMNGELIALHTSQHRDNVQMGFGTPVVVKAAQDAARK